MAQILPGGPGFTARKPRLTTAQAAAVAAEEAMSAAKASRKLRTRQHIITGGALMGLAEAGDPDAQRLLARVLRGLTRPQDRRAFDLPAAEDGSA